MMEEEKEKSKSKEKEEAKNVKEEEKKEESNEKGKDVIKEKKEDEQREKEGEANKNKNNKNKDNKITVRKGDDEYIIIESDEINNLTEQEINDLKILLDKHYNRVIFFQLLNEFRSTGKLGFNEKIGEIVIDIFNVIISKIKRDNDIYSGKNAVLFSQTYFLMEDGNKKYLQEYIVNNEIFKELKFWEDFLDLDINREIKHIEMLEEKRKKNNDENKKDINLDAYKFEHIIFGQIASVCDNMISFGVQKAQIYNVIEPKMKKYNLSKEISDNIDSIIENRINEEKEKEIQK